MAARQSQRSDCLFTSRLFGVHLGGWRQNHRDQIRVDKPGALVLQLIAHATRAENNDVEVLVEAFNCPADRLANLIAAVAGGSRIHHHVDREGDHQCRPLLRLVEHHRKWNGQSMVDVHFIHDGQVKFIKDQRLRDVAGEYRVAVACLSFGERGESAKLWKQEGMTLEVVKQAREEEAKAAANALGVNDILHGAEFGASRQRQPRANR